MMPRSAGIQVRPDSQLVGHFGVSVVSVLEVVCGCQTRRLVFRSRRSD